MDLHEPFQWERGPAAVPQQVFQPRVPRRKRRQLSVIGKRHQPKRMRLGGGARRFFISQGTASKGWAGWSDSRQLVERFAPGCGAIRPSIRSWVGIARLRDIAVPVALTARRCRSGRRRWNHDLLPALTRRGAKTPRNVTNRVRVGTNQRAPSGLRSRHHAISCIAATTPVAVGRSCH